MSNADPNSSTRSLPFASPCLGSRERSADLPPGNRISVPALLGILLLSLLAAWPGAAQSSPSESSERFGTYVVRPGDTLRDISRRYSGGEERWQENARLNPQVRNPDYLLPGQRLRIVLAAPVPPSTARVRKISRLVEEKPNPNPWTQSSVDNLLIEEDGLRTREDSSSELHLPGGVVLKVTESSLIFLEKVENRLRGVPREEIEIVEGQADLEARSEDVEPTAEIEIILGEARATPQSGPEGALATRARAAETGAQLMVYEGTSSLQAAQGRVEVAKGMGSTVKAGQPPTPPEELLPAPALRSPEGGSSWARPDPPLRWQAVPGAAGYVVEICRDPGCGALERRLTDVRETSLDPEPLPIGRYYWRATAIAESGLDGFPAEVREFTITSDRLDRAPPEGNLRVEGRQMRRGTKLVVGENGQLVAEASDAILPGGEGDARETTSPDGSALSWIYLLDGREVPFETWKGGWPAGAHSFEARVSDPAGNTTDLGPLELVSDPKPPELKWEKGGVELLQRYGETELELSALKRRARRRDQREGRLFAWSGDGVRWLSLRAPTARSRTASQARAGSDRPQLFLRALSDRPFGPGAPVSLARGEVLRLWAEDEGVGVEALRVWIDSGAEQPVLRIEVIDLLGNAQEVQWPLALRE